MTSAKNGVPIKYARYRAGGEVAYGIVEGDRLRSIKGEPLLRLVRMDRLRVAGHVNAAHYGPHEVAGRAVSIRARLERGRDERFTGKITFVHPEQNGGDYLVWAEVDNRTIDAKQIGSGKSS